MYAKLKESGRSRITILLVAMTLFCFSLSIARFVFTGTKDFLFLNWNLFLAFIPWALSSIIIIYGLQKKKLALIFLLPVWLLFFPNSPYILTDLLHLNILSSAPVWYDMIIILSFAWAGLLYGFISLMDIENILNNYMNKLSATLITIFLLFIGSFGIYLGRYLRWNSWDIISNPFGLFSDIMDRLIDPLDHPRTWGMTILMGLLLNMIYFSIKFLKESKQ